MQPSLTPENAIPNQIPRTIHRLDFRIKRRSWSGSTGQDRVIVQQMVEWKHPPPHNLLLFAAMVEDCGCLSGPPAKVVVALAALLHH